MPNDGKISFSHTALTLPKGEAGVSSRPRVARSRFQYHYDRASSEIKRSTYLNNVTVEQSCPPDSLDRMASRWLKKNGTPFSAEFYTYDRMSRLTQVARAGKSHLFGYYLDGEMYWTQYGVDTDMPEGAARSGPGHARHHSAVGRLARQSGAGTHPATGGRAPPTDVVEEPDVATERWVNYFLDRAGNRTSINDTGVNKTYTPNNLNQYMAAEGRPVNNGVKHEVTARQGVNYIYRNDEQLIHSI